MSLALRASASAVQKRQAFLCCNFIELGYIMVKVATIFRPLNRQKMSVNGEQNRHSGIKE